MKRKISASLLAALLIAAPVLSSCGESATENVSAATTTASQTEALT